jgi:RNA polymerase sigma factor (sigma-70 family)
VKYTQQDILDNMELVYKLAHFMKARHTNALLDVDDLVSEGIFGLFKAFANWDPEKSNFETFAGRKIKYAMMDAHRRAFKQHRYDKRFGLPTPTYLPLDAIEGGDEILTGDFLSEDDTIDMIDSILVLKHTWEKLNFRQRHIIRLLLGGKTQQEAAAIIGVTPGAIHSSYHKALGKIRHYHENYRRER